MLSENAYRKVMQNLLGLRRRGDQSRCPAGNLLRLAGSSILVLNNPFTRAAGHWHLVLNNALTTMSLRGNR